MNTTKERFMSIHIPLKHRMRLWSSLRWGTLILAALFGVAYIGIIMLLPPISNLQRIYPDILPQIGFYIHAFPGAIWLIFGALQFFSSIRAKNPKAHRIMGLIALFSVLISLVGLLIIIGSGKTEGGKSLQIFGILFGAAWILCLVLGWYYMRYQKNIEKHREWMTRAYILSYAIVFMRPGVLLYVFLDPSTSQGDALAVVAPFTWILALIIIELYVRRERANQVNMETHYIAVPATAVSEEDGARRLVTFKRDFVAVTLVQKQELTPIAALFVFQLPATAELLMFPGHYVVLRRQTKTQVICRPYSPVTDLVRHFGRQGSTHPTMPALNQPGTVALAVKKYRNGAMSSWLHDSLKIGDTVEMMGPAGGFYYTPNEYAALGLVAGGTGITPMLSLIMAVLTNSSDRSTITLVYATSSPQDTMFHEELDELARQYPQKFQVKYAAGSGRVTRALLRENLPGPSDQSLVVLCGPTGFCTSIQKSLAKLKYEEHSVFTFGETDK